MKNLELKMLIVNIKGIVNYVKSWVLYNSGWEIWLIIESENTT